MDITVILNAHREGLLAHPSCSSIEIAKRAAEEAGISVEVLVLLDRPDADTTDFFSHRAQSDWKLYRVDLGDPGLARNEGVRNSSGRWVAFLDADDLFAKSWLLAAYNAAASDKRLVVWHPEISIYFGQDQHIFKHVDMDDDGVDASGLISSNYWTALCFAPKSLLEQVPYRPSCLERQLGYEDWTWNQDVIACGAVHKVVPRTGHLIRVKQNSIVRQTSRAGCIPIPSDYLLNLLRRKELDSRMSGQAIQFRK